MGSSGSSVATLAFSCSRPAGTVVDFLDTCILGPKLSQGTLAEVYATKEIHEDTARASTRKAVKVSDRATQESNRAMLREGDLAGTLVDFHDKYILGPKLGRGNFAEVYDTKEIHEDTARASTRKAVKVSNRATQESKRAMLLEEDIWKAVGHGNCVRLYEVFHDESLSYMVMERCDCSLHRHIMNIPDLTERTLGPILSQMLQSLYQVHSSHVVHRDIKPDNFLAGGADGQTVKLCDFGLSAILLKGTRKLSDIVGTAPFMCPEMVLGKGYDFKADVWSVGVIAYTFLLGNFPYMSKTGDGRLMKKAIAEGATPTFIPVGNRTSNGSQFRSSTALDFVRSLLSRQPEQRPSAIMACNMEYMTSGASGNHAVAVHLPSLKPMISSAQHVGAFGIQDIHKQVEVDTLLRELQMVKFYKQLAMRQKTISKKDPNDTFSDSMSVSSTTCPSDDLSRTSSKASAEIERQASTPKQKVVLSI